MLPVRSLPTASGSTGVGREATTAGGATERKEGHCARWLSIFPSCLSPAQSAAAVRPPRQRKSANGSLARVEGGRRYSFIHLCFLNLFSSTHPTSSYIDSTTWVSIVFGVATSWIIALEGKRDVNRGISAVARRCEETARVWSHEKHRQSPCMLALAYGMVVISQRPPSIQTSSKSISLLIRHCRLDLTSKASIAVRCNHCA